MKPKCPRMTVSGWGLTCNTSQPNLTFHWKSIGKYEQMWGFFLPTGWFLYYALPFSSLRGSFQHTYKVHLPSSFNDLIFPCHSVPFSSQQLVLPSYFSVLSGWVPPPWSGRVYGFFPRRDSAQAQLMQRPRCSKCKIFGIALPLWGSHWWCL